MAHPQPYDREQLDRELQAMVMADSAAVGHALICDLCGVRDVALTVLALAGLDETTFYAKALVQEFPDE